MQFVKSFFSSCPTSFAGLFKPCILGSRNKNSSNTISNILKESNIRNPPMYFTLILNLHKSFTIEKLVEWQKWALGQSILRLRQKSHGVRGSPLSAYCSFLSRTSFPAAFKSVSPRHLLLAKIMYSSEVSTKTRVAGRTTGVTVNTRPRMKRAYRHISFSGVNIAYLLHKVLVGWWWKRKGEKTLSHIFVQTDSGLRCQASHNSQALWTIQRT